MVSAVSLQASSHKYLTDKYKGNISTSFAEHVNSVLSAAAIPLNFEKNKSEAFKAYTDIIDFRPILIDSLNNLLIDKWSSTSETWRIWVNNYGLPDFKQMGVTAAGVVKKPSRMVPGSEYKKGTLYGETAYAQLESYGDILLLERQTIINDDVSAVQSFAGGIAAAYDRQIGDQVYDFLITNPVSFNATELFHADHNNIVAATSDFQADLAKAIEVMYAQKMVFDPQGVSETLRIQPRYVIVPPAKMFTASKIVGEYNQAVTDSQKLTVIVESRLTGFSGWFLACDNPHASISQFTLSDRVIPEVFTQAMFNTDGIEIKHRFDYDVSPIDYRGLIRVA